MPFPLSNLLIESLPAATKTSLLQHLEPVPLPVGARLFEAEERPRHVHFLTSGMASIVTAMEDGTAVEVGVVGREGIPQASHLLAPGLNLTQCFMQVPGSGFRMDYRTFQRLFFKDEVQQLVFRYAQYQGQILSQMAACNRLHEVEERLARWLLMVQDRIDNADLPLTQNFLGNMLGTRRSTVTIMVGTLQRGGLIRHQRGFVHILNRPGLEDTACECYAVTKKLFDQLY